MRRAFCFATIATLLISEPLSVVASQTDLVGPAGSAAFGATVALLPNSNIVVVDPNLSVSTKTNVGGVYLYSPGLTLISVLTGSSPNDHIGSGGIVQVGSGNFVVLSPAWNNGTTSSAGAVTWVSGVAGLNGVVTAANSLVGAAAFEDVGGQVTALSNGNYVVASSGWNGYRGAATWGSGTTGVQGTVSASNSLVGTAGNDLVSSSGITPLDNGNYVVSSHNWNSNRGAVTWGNGSVGVTGTISAANSLIGGAASDYVGFRITALANGNYVVASPYWSGNMGAATWCSGTTGGDGTISGSNSLVGIVANDEISSSGITALNNGNYVVGSINWSSNRGAATWGSGASGIIGNVSVSNSIVGTAANDEVGITAVALTNGNYVIASSHWNGFTGAATWGNGTTGTSGNVSASNSIVGTAPNDRAALSITALKNSNYVVNSPDWGGSFGAVTWGSGTSGSIGGISIANSLVGSAATDYVGDGGIAALNTGDYVVGSPLWNGGIGAATWCNGSAGLIGTISTGNSLVGAAPNDRVGQAITALSNSSYVVGSSFWNGSRGAATWRSLKTGATGTVSPVDSLVGTNANDNEGANVIALSDGNYVAFDSLWNGGHGAITMGNGTFALAGQVQPWNSVIGVANNFGNSMTFVYDSTHQRLIVGRPGDNIVSLFAMDQIFGNGFE
jgi:hypothetical protein